jgi:conjugative transfer region lipoprotein (TIGR03751 family)
MALNKRRRAIFATVYLSLAAAGGLAGCSVAGPRHSPVNDITKDSPTVLDIYRGQGVAGGAGQGNASARPAARDLLRDQSRLRPVAVGDDQTQRYWSAVEPMRQRFARIPNPDLVMVVFPHLSAGKYPVPGYVTVFPMYQQTEYGLPGEVQQDLADGRAAYDSAQAAQAATKEGH